MTNDEIIEVIQARKAGMRIQCNINKNNPGLGGWVLKTHDGWDFHKFIYRVHPDDAPKWEHIKGERLAEQVKPAPDLPEKAKRAIVACEELERMLNEGCTIKAQRTGGVRIGKDCAPIQGLYITGPKEAPDLPPLPEKDLVVLPVEFVLPEGVARFEGWVLSETRGHWNYSDDLCGHPGDPWMRYAVRADSEIAKINGMGRSDDMLPPVPEGAAPLPKKYVMPEGTTLFDGWMLDDKGWGVFTKDFIGPDHLARFAVKPDTEIARLNGVGFGPCPSRWGWHNPEGLTPQQVGVPEYRLLCRDEVGNREEMSDDIMTLRDSSFYGANGGMTYLTAAPYGSLPPVTEHTFPECAGERAMAMKCPKCGDGLLFSEDRGVHCDGCDDFDPSGVQWMDKDSTPREIGWYYVHEENGSVGSRYWDDSGGGVWWNSNARDGWTPNNSFIEWAYIPEIHSVTGQKPKPTYGHDLDGNPVPDVDDRHEIIPEGARVHEGEVTHIYSFGSWSRWVLKKDPRNTVSGVHGPIRAYARKKYSVIHRESGIKPGDVVEVTRAAEDYERGWNRRFPKIPCQSYVGRKGKVVEDRGPDGFEVLFTDGYRLLVPAFVLRKVERRKVPLEYTFKEVRREIESATDKFPTWPTDTLHAVAVVAEEMGELQKEVLQLTYEPHKSTPEDVRKEAVQLAAMSIRFLMSLDRYEYKPREQHSQCWKWADEGGG